MMTEIVETQLELTLEQQYSIAAEALTAIQKQILDAVTEKRAAAITEVLQKIKEHGLSAADLGLQADAKKSGVKLERKAAPIKYRDPANLENTWSGRGRTPNWLSAEIKLGKTAADFAVTG